MTYPLTVSMTPAYISPCDSLLRAQLRCLSEQTVKDFDVWLIDCHYQKRKDYVPELAERYRLNIVHIPYAPNTRVAKRLDCSIFNAGFMYSQSVRNVRYSCWRFVRPKFVEVCLSIPDGVNCDFDFLNVMPTLDNAHPVTQHPRNIWDYGSDEVHWDQVPKRAGQSGAAWDQSSDLGKHGPRIVPANCYGNIMWTRANWLALNGTDEAFTNLYHPEDMDFCQRAIHAGQRAIRWPHLMYRLSHQHGEYGGYANAPPDVPYREPCVMCKYVNHHGYSSAQRATMLQLEEFPADGVWVCRDCLLCGCIGGADCVEFMEHTRQSKQTQARIIPKYMIGRNLRILAADMDKVCLSEKVRLYNESSHCESRYYATV